MDEDDVIKNIVTFEYKFQWKSIYFTSHHIRLYEKVKEKNHIINLYESQIILYMKLSQPNHCVNKNDNKKLTQVWHG